MKPFRFCGFSARTAAAFAVFAGLLWSFPSQVFAADAAAGKTGNMSAIYGVLFGLAALLLLGYCLLVRKKSLWFLLLYGAVFVVNGGYLMLSLAQDLESAMLANQVSYFGAAMLPLAMLMIVVNTCRIPLPRWLTAALALVSLAAFLLAASGDSLGLYYKEVTLVEVNGVSCLSKVYGPLHFLYTVYLLSYFGLMIAAIAFTAIRQTLSSCRYVVFLAASVFGNLAVWLVEQLIAVEFEFLAVSYIATELVLLSVHGILQDPGLAAAPFAAQAPAEGAVSTALPPDVEDLFAAFSARAAALTATERSILQYYADGRDVNEVAELAFISIHTVRKHNANIYQKLGVGSRDELMLYLELFRRSGRLDQILQPDADCPPQ